MTPALTILSPGRAKSFLLMSAIICLSFKPAQELLSPAGHTFSLVPSNRYEQRDEFIRFSDREFSLIYYSDSNGMRRKSVVAGHWLQKNKAIHLYYDAGRIDTGIISIMRFDKAAILNLEMNSKYY